VPLLRVSCGMLSEVWPEFEIGIYLSGMAWILIFFLWALRYVPYYFKVAHRVK